MIYFLHNSAQNTFRLLENLLEWSRIQISGVKVVPEKIDAEELISDTAETLIESASRKNITVSVNTEKNFRIYTDADMLKTIVRNLLSNAVKFTPKGGSIYLTASKTKTGLKITVRDNGRGMPGEKLKTLFVLEKNTSTNGTDGEKGTGLGLVLCKEFTEKLQGRITAESAVGKGTTVTVEIPAYKK
jgi:signal transduction histidine kinase